MNKPKIIKALITSAASDCDFYFPEGYHAICRQFVRQKFPELSLEYGNLVIQASKKSFPKSVRVFIKNYRVGEKANDTNNKFNYIYSTAFDKLCKAFPVYHKYDNKARPLYVRIRKIAIS